MWRPAERIKHALPDGGWPTAEEAAGSRWFSPLQVGPMRLAQRTWIPAMVPWRASEEGEVTPAVLDWYRRFAQGRPGAIVVEATGIRDVPSGPLLRIGHDRFVPGLRALVEAVREASGGETRLLIQLIDFLRIRRRPDRERFLTRFLALRPQHLERLELPADAPEADVRAALLARDDDALREVLDAREHEALTMGARERVDDMDLPHVAELPRVLPGLFADAAARAEAAGFCGVELHYAHAYTMASFLSPTNRRDDGYGGDLAGRLRLPLEVLAGVRARVGPELCVGARFLTDEIIAGGGRVGDAAAYALAFAEAGIDFVSLSRGGKFDDAAQPKVGAAAYPYTGPSGYECMPTVHSDAAGPFGRNAADSASVRAALRAAGHSQPVITAGGVASFAQAEALLADGAADVVAAARQSLADPDWFRKVREGRGAEVRRCKFTNYCEALDQRHLEVTCQRWDREPGGPRSADGKRRLVAPPDRA